MAHGDDMEWMRAKQLIKPEDQLELTDKDLKEDIARVLTTVNPQAPSNIVQYKYKEYAYVRLPPPGATVPLIDIEGTWLHKDSEEAQMQLAGVTVFAVSEEEEEEEEKERVEEEEEGGEEEEEGAEGEGEEAPVEVPEEAKEEVKEEGEVEGEGEGEGGEEGEERGEGDEGGEEGEDVEKKESDTAAESTGPKKVPNQFNFCERAALTYNNPFRDRSSQTIPPACAKFVGQATPSIIFDAYEEDFAIQQAEKEKEEREKKAVTVAIKKEEVKKKDTGQAEDLIHALLKVKILERMVNQIKFDEIAQDFRFWEDPADEFVDEMGTLLPLWKFVYEKTTKNNVAGVCWNPHYYDLFAVAFGFFDHNKPQPEGALCLFTLKNPSYPEYICATPTGVVCVDIHPSYPSLIAIGMHDGHVAIYNAKESTTEPLSRSNSHTKHAGTVWQVQWGQDLPEGEICFFSVSEDGCVFHWINGRNGLDKTIITKLYLLEQPITGPYGTTIDVTCKGTAIVFHPKQPDIFLVGTQEGFVFKCNIAYSGFFLDKFQAHDHAVQRIDYNKFNPDIYATCSADWRIKVWEDNRSDALFLFDLSAPVGDVAWAPYSSTIFAATTDDGKIHVFDLAVNKSKPICIQPVVSKGRKQLTRLAFNYKMPTLIVGDSGGTITSLKLSPNLRKKVRPSKKGPVLTHEELELNKLDKLLSVIREPPALMRPPDKAEDS